MKRILVTGSNGLLGQKLTELLVKQPDIVLIATSKGEDRYPDQDGYLYRSLDISDEAAIRRVVAETNPDVIIHTAAVTNVDVCEVDKQQCYHLNVQVVANLAAICYEHDIHLIHLSTDFVFDGENGPYREDDLPNPLSYYGYTKYEAEKVLQNAPCRWTIVRTILVYGILQDMSRSNIILWAKGALEKQQPIRVVNDQWRMPTLAEDLAMACLLIAQKEAYGIYHISGKDMMSIFELVNRVAAFWKLDQSLIIPVSSDELNQTANRPAKTGFILDKAIAGLNYQPHSFAEGLSEVDRQLSSRIAQREINIKH
ncbi:dTDP-4-dehydrorhamnose reductase [Pedobacter sp. BS3]|uniref:dTDP-4-dehydrorhamnose reductase n=1 Tax=Pedobacter sp. BS3 TaxID=2567937 RepID=UPI0011EE16B6|nr:dTDP-4-dehydrorhamnose reductase [Pedobacter sp. BS3]TZF83139.1 dTDP-4-dehydrorhamnose reductase [Pedobacter sp. BS3]